MMRIIGALLIITGSVSAGLYIMYGYAERVKVLSALVNAMEIIHAELTQRMTPLPEIMERLISVGECAQTSAFFRRVKNGTAELGDKSFASIWETAINETPEMKLNTTEREVLSSLGKMLGRYDAKTQAKAVEYSKTRFAGFLQRAERERTERGKVAGALSLAAGISVVIILI